ncbi:MAG: aminotransferase class I/II-fold pyridoxal phosphate-dependent enzyme [Candidatus Thermoplasmatota archaeon]|nr:aminotransferase class I/II-fold pyridoxal phosphate-dependent enzyme [Candidatus Thermoplasmatota archaeon]
MPDIPDHLIRLKGGFKAFLSPPPDGVVRLTVGEPGFDTPKGISQAAIDALMAGDTHYTRGEGREGLCTAWASHLRSRWKIPVEDEGIVITPGAKQALLYAFMVAAQEDDEVILLAPCWPTHAEQVELVGAKPVFVHCEAPAFHPNVDQIRDAITDKTSAIVVNSPNNPTGAVYTPEEMIGIVELAIEFDLWIISDEIYTELVWNGTEHVPPAAVLGGFERTLTVTGPSKTHAMTGWRVGVFAAPTTVAKTVGRLQGNTCSHIPSFLMPAAELAAKDWSSVAEFREEYIRRRELMLELLEGVPSLTTSEPEGAFYVMVDVRETGMDATTFARRAMEEALVQVIPLDSLPGGEGYIRLSYASDDDVIREGIQRLKAWLD